MEDYFPTRLKRKDIEDVNDDFSDFSLSSPARKIRRLDAELPPIIEEDECEISIPGEESLPYEHSFVNNYSSGIRIEELPDEPINEERAIVLLKPRNNNQLLQSLSKFSISPSLISGFKNQILSSSQSISWNWNPTGVKETENDHSSSGSRFGAVVPWVPSRFSPALEAKESPPQVDNSQMMDAQEVVDEEATMDIEDSPPSINQGNVNSISGSGLGQQFHQWQQQHCLIPQPLHNSTTPIVWYQ